MPNMPVVLDHDVGSVVYEHVRKMIEGLARRAVRMGYDEIEVTSAANYGFTIALRDYDQNKDFVRWVKFKVRRQLFDLKRRKGTKRLPLWTGNSDEFDLEFDPPDQTTEEPEPFDLTAQLVRMGDDARAWVSLVIDPPQSVLTTARELGWGTGEAANRASETAAYRQAVFTFLRESGWSNRRINRAYYEACEVLGG